MRIFSFVLLFLLSISAQPTLAQSTNPAMLVADSVYLRGRDTLVAEGNVEALQGENRLSARRILFDRTTGDLTIEGPITLRQGDSIIVLADAAQLDSDMRNGLMMGARMVMDQQLQLAAHQLNRVNGRYSQLYKASVTSCRVCGNGKPPLWQIRARRVIHDQQEQQLYFEQAQFLIGNTPVFYLPRLRLPDPSLKRATGFLIPSIRRNSKLGTGVKIPYFIRLGDHRDATLTPYLSSETRTLQLRYRQAFRNGWIEFDAAASQDTLKPGQVRSFVNFFGNFDLRRDFKLIFDIEATSDNTYPVDYGFSDKDRLDSEIAISRTRRDEYIRAGLLHYHSLRVTENNSTLPTLIGDLRYERRHFPIRLGGELRMIAAAHSHYRYSNLSTDGPDANPWADGLDVARLSTDVSWRRNWTLTRGLRLGVVTGLAIDNFQIDQGGLTTVKSATQVTPTAAINLRWPLRKATARGTVHIVEPMVQLAWAGGNNPNVPNDESTRVEFDEGNLLGLSRFPSRDRRERGYSLALGSSWTRIAPSGWQSGLTIGQIIRPAPHANFSQSSGLSGAYSDVLLAGHLKSRDGLALTARGLFDKGLDISKAEARADWRRNKYGLAASYVWLGADPAENRAATQSEWSLDGYYRLSRHWTGTANWRFDVASRSTAEAGLGVQYRNECVDVNLSASRRFTSSIILTPSTDYSFTIGLRGFSAKTDDQSFTRTCSN